MDFKLKIDIGGFLISFPIAVSNHHCRSVFVETWALLIKLQLRSSFLLKPILNKFLTACETRKVLSNAFHRHPFVNHLAIVVLTHKVDSCN